jgi:hypothetical protein
LSSSTEQARDRTSTPAALVAGLEAHRSELLRDLEALVRSAVEKDARPVLSVYVTGPAGEFSASGSSAATGWKELMDYDLDGNLPLDVMVVIPASAAPLHLRTGGEEVHAYLEHLIIDDDLVAECEEILASLLGVQLLLRSRS